MARRKQQPDQVGDNDLSLDDPYAIRLQADAARNLRVSFSPDSTMTPFETATAWLKTLSEGYAPGGEPLVEESTTWTELAELLPNADGSIDLVVDNNSGRALLRVEFEEPSN